MLNRLPPSPFTPRQVLGALVVLFVLVALGVTLCVRPTPQTTACSTTLGPGDSGIQTWLASAQPGQILCLKPGVYTGSANMLSIPSSFAGTASAPITIRAETPGTVTIDGQDSRRPIHTRGTWGVLRGLNATRGDNMNVFVDGTDWLLQDLVSWDVGVKTDHNISMAGYRNTVEDFAVFGTAEKQLAMGASSGNCTGNVARRGVLIWQGAGDSTSPTNGAEIGYGQRCLTVENLVGTYARTGNRSQPEGIYEIFRTKQSKLLGSIAYVLRDAVYDPSALVFGITDAGSHADTNPDPAQDVLVKHILSYIDPAHPEFANKRALRFDYDPPGPHGTNNRAESMVGVSGQPLSCQGPSWQCVGVQQGATLAAAIGGEGKSVWTDSNAAPGICRRYVNGVLTDTPLWPLPITERLKSAMTQAGQTPVDVTQVLEGLFGTIPAQCKTGGTPVPPEPGPEPTPPGGHVTLACSGTLQAIPGPISLQCVPQTRR